MKLTAMSIAICEVCEDEVWEEEPHAATDTGFRCADCMEDE